MNALVLLPAFPPITPRFDFPGSSILVIGLDVVLGFSIFGLIGLFILGVLSTVAAFRSGKGVGGPAISSLLALVAIAILSTATVFINGWTSYIS